MKDRIVITTIDTILALLRDYVPEGSVGADSIPADAQPIKFMYRPSERGKLGILVESNSWTGGGAPIEIKFELRRSHLVGG